MSTSSKSPRVILLCLAVAVTFFSSGVVAGNLATTLSLRKQLMAYDELVKTLHDTLFQYGQCVVYMDHYRRSLIVANKMLVEEPKKPAKKAAKSATKSQRRRRR